MTDYKPVEVKVWGDFACFTRPEMKVERVSYEIPTPSAARGILEAIFWKPEFSWQIQEIVVLEPIRRMSILRNEVNKKIAYNTVKKGESRYMADQDRAQRHALILRDVSYIIRAEPVPHREQNGARAKYRSQFRRRVSRGQCAWQPYLGCREFSAYFAEPDGTEEPVALTMGLGRMLFDLAYDSKGKANPYFFSASLEEGVVSVPAEIYGQIKATRPKPKARKKPKARQ